MAKMRLPPFRAAENAAASLAIAVRHTASATAFAAKTLHLPCISTGSEAKTLPLPGVSIAVAAKTPPFPCGPPQVAAAVDAALAQQTGLQHAVDEKIREAEEARRLQRETLVAAAAGLEEGGAYKAAAAAYAPMPWRCVSAVLRDSKPAPLPSGPVGTWRRCRTQTRAQRRGR